MTRVLLLFTLVLGVAGCFRAHERELGDAGLDSALPDALPDTGHDAFTLPDTGPPDAFVPDAGSCMHPSVGRPLHTCVLAATGTIPADEPYSLPLTFARCECPETRRCDVAIAGDHISLTTAVCEDVVACDECEFDVGCALPPLPSGHYFIDVNGVRTTEVDARPRFVPPVAHPVCAPIPAAPDEAFVCDLDHRIAPALPLRVCRPSFEDVGRYVRIQVTVGCPQCFDADGGCDAQLDGDRVVLRPRMHRCDCPTCGICDPSCTPLTITCATPPLSSGIYALAVELADGEHPAGPLEIRDVFEPGPDVCTDVP